MPELKAISDGADMPAHRALIARDTSLQVERLADLVSTLVFQSRSAGSTNERMGLAAKLAATQVLSHGAVSSMLTAAKVVGKANSLTFDRARLLSYQGLRYAPAMPLLLGHSSFPLGRQWSAAAKTTLDLLFIIPSRAQFTRLSPRLGSRNFSRHGFSAAERRKKRSRRCLPAGCQLC